MNQRPACLAQPFVAGRVVLRRLAPADLAAFQRYRTDPGVGRYQGWSALPDAAAAEFLATMATAPGFERATWFQFGIAEPASDALIGDIGVRIDALARTADIGFTLTPAAQGRGLATDALRGAVQLVFGQTPVECIRGVTDARNLPSIRLLERLGMRRIGTTATTFRGESCTEHTYALDRMPPS